MRTTRSDHGAGAALAAGLAALALGACGGGSGGDAAADDRERLEQAGLKHARCMREHGIDVPDPKPGDGGVIRVGPEQGDMSKQRRAIEECEKYLKDIPPPKLSDEQKAEMRDAALAHSRCMREQGIDFPDPKFGPDGSVTVRIGPGGVDPNDPKLRAAERACARHMPRIGGGPGPGAAP